jgi:gentisate 1,2-dioxygenase
MINIEFTGNSPIFYQIDRSYNQPGFTGAVQWNGYKKCFEVSDGTNWIRIDNNINFHSDIDMYKIAQWAMNKMAEEQKEKDLRSKYPALDQAYKDLELIKGLIADDI